MKRMIDKNKIPPSLDTDWSKIIQVYIDIGTRFSIVKNEHFENNQKISSMLKGSSSACNSLITNPSMINKEFH